jgi:hypothetical protein
LLISRRYALMIYGDFRMFYKAEKSGEKNDLMSLYLQIQIPLTFYIIVGGKWSGMVYLTICSKKCVKITWRHGFKHKNSGYWSGLRCFTIGGLFATKHSVIGLISMKSDGIKIRPWSTLEIDWFRCLKSWWKNEFRSWIVLHCLEEVSDCTIMWLQFPTGR